jgi:hypothetical protein
MIIAEITSLTHSHRVQLSIFVDAIPSILVAAILTVTGWAHVFCVVLALDVRAFWDFHGLLKRVVLDKAFVEDGGVKVFCNGNFVGFLFEVFLVHKFVLNEKL